jgi:hypothetical protein
VSEHVDDAREFLSRGQVTAEAAAVGGEVDAVDDAADRGDAFVWRSLENRGLVANTRPAEEPREPHHHSSGCSEFCRSIIAITARRSGCSRSRISASDQ